jgi:putative membrane protein
VRSCVFTVMVAFLTVGLTSVYSAGQGAAVTQVTAPAEFVKTVATGGSKEVAVGKLAAEKATNPDAKAFASRMVTDHSKANESLVALAAKKSWSATPDTASYKPEFDKLAALSGAAFDRAYMDVMVAAHEKTIALMEQQAKNGTDPDLKAWAAKTLPTVQQHLKLARDTRAKLGS